MMKNTAHYLKKNYSWCQIRVITGYHTSWYRKHGIASPRYERASSGKIDGPDKQLSICDESSLINLRRRCGKNRWYKDKSR